MKFYALALLATTLGSFNATADVTCAATKTTTVLIADKISVGPFTEEHEVYVNPEKTTQIGAARFQGLQVAIQFSDDFAEASDISNYFDQMGDTRFRQQSTSVPLKVEADGSVSISHKLELYAVGSDRVDEVEITLSCKK